MKKNMGDSGCSSDSMGDDNMDVKDSVQKKIDKIRKAGKKMNPDAGMTRK